MKACSKCSENREFTDFYKDKNAKGGFRAICKFCDKVKATKWNKNNPEKHCEHEKKYRSSNKQQMKVNKSNYVKNNPDSVKNSALKFNYNITLEEFNLMKSRQNNCCLICKTHEDDLKIKLCVDHCHTTGKIRGILCTSCNLALGLMKDNVATLRNAINYLEENEDV